MTKKTKKKFTVPEFKTWLEGIMQFQDDNWSPNRDQWDEIYEKIMNLKEPVNKEKMSLTDSALDEINGIVYDQIREAFSNFRPPQQMHPQPQPQNQPLQVGHSQPLNPPGTANPSAGSVDPNQLEPLKQPNPAGGLEDIGLEQLKKRQEERHQQVGQSGAASHKLPDVDGMPEDFA